MSFSSFTKPLSSRVKALLSQVVTQSGQNWQNLGIKGRFRVVSSRHFLNQPLTLGAFKPFRRLEWQKPFGFTLDMRVEQRRMLVILLSCLAFLGGLQLLAPQLSAMVVVLGMMVLYVASLSAVLTVKHIKTTLSQNPLLQSTLNQLTLNPPNALTTPAAPSEAALPSLAILVPAHNEAAVIEATALALLEQDYPHYSLWVIDDRSTDGTAEKLAALKAQLDATGETRFQYLVRPPEARPGKSAVLNDALALCGGELIAVFDADARMAPNFLSQMVAVLQEPVYPQITDPQDNPVVAVQARKVILNNGDNWLTRCQNYEYAFDAYVQSCRDLARGAVELRGNGQLVKRTALEALGGWNEATVTDDLDLSTRIHLAGWDIRFASQLAVLEEGITDWKPLYRQRTRWAEGSLRRYLEFGGSVLWNPQVGHRTRADMLAYFLNFLFPLLLIMDNARWLLVSALWPHLQQTPFLLSFGIVPLFAVAFIPTIYIGLRQFKTHPDLAYLEQSPWPRFKTIGAALSTSLFMTAIWVPVVFYTWAKLMVQPNRPFVWVKTSHGQA